MNSKLPHYAVLNGGVYSAVGLLFADFEATRARAYLGLLTEDTAPEVEALLSEMEAEVLDELGVAASRLHWSADLR